MNMRGGMVAAAILAMGIAPSGWAAQSPVPAFVMFSPPVHQILVLLHVFGAIIFMGNLVVSAMWLAMARRTHNVDVLHFACGAVIRADWMFTLPGALLILGPGLLIVGPWGGFPGATWAELALAFFILSGIIWVVALIPLQRRMKQMTQEAVELKIALSDRFYTLVRKWTMWGGIATLLPLASLFLMVFKPALWRG